MKDLVKKGKKLNSAQLEQIDLLVSELGGIRHAQDLANDFTNSALALLEKNFAKYPGYEKVADIVRKMLTRNC
ncbi:hypothetical protein SDC49_10485 [Lactobacillus sp. R2/2]|nr:hypothetical protein [Lactobacillus sp. R2/2]